MTEMNRQEKHAKTAINNWDNIIIPTKMGKTYNSMNTKSIRFYRFALVVTGLAILVIGISGILK